MFTGLITHFGEIQAYTPKPSGQGVRLTVSGHFKEFILGESIACNGVCLTLANITSDGKMQFDLSTETLSKTHFSPDLIGQVCHLERALRMGDSVGGHWVSGHVDGLATLTAIEQLDTYQNLRFKYHPHQAIEPAWHPKGAIALDGVSLTLNMIQGLCFEVMLVPHTLSHTHFHKATTGQIVHVEFDLMNKAIAYQLKTQALSSTGA